MTVWIYRAAVAEAPYLMKQLLEASRSGPALPIVDT